MNLRPLLSLPVAALLAVAGSPPVLGVARDVVNEARSAYEGRTLRLRLDLKSAASAIEPNVLTLEGIGYGRPDAPVLFGRLETVYLERVKSKGPKGDSWSSMVRSGDRIYILNQSGDCYVLRASPKFEVLATNGLGSELTNASLAVSDGRLFIRTHEHLYCIAK